MTAKRKYFSKAASCLVIGFFGMGVLFLSFRSDFKEKPFEPKAWKEGGHRLRGEMAADLERSKLLLGKTKAEVLDLLGKSPGTNEAVWGYPLDSGHSFGLRWQYQIYIYFDTNNNVVTNVMNMD